MRFDSFYYSRWYTVEKDKTCRDREMSMAVPVRPGPPLTNQTPACCLPLPEGGTVLAVLLLQHTVVAEVLLAASP